jgi:hypothetical protein
MPKFTLYVITRSAGCVPGARAARSGACEHPASNAKINATGTAIATFHVIAIDAARGAGRRQVTGGMAVS